MSRDPQRLPHYLRHILEGLDHMSERIDRIEHRRELAKFPDRRRPWQP